MKEREFVHKAKTKGCRGLTVSLGQKMEVRKLWLWGWGSCLVPADPSLDSPGMPGCTPNTSTHVPPNPLSALGGTPGSGTATSFTGQNENTVKDTKLQAFSSTALFP